MTEVWKSLLTSKRFIAFAVTSLTVIMSPVVGLFGYEVDTVKLGIIAAGAATFILSQGFADHGKEAAKIAAAANKSPDLSQGGFIRVGLMLAIATACAGILLAGCAAGRNKALGASVATLTAGELALHTYAHQHTEDVINGAPKTEDGIIAARNTIDAFRAKVDHAQADIDAGWRLSGAAGAANDDPSVAKFSAVVQAVVAELVAIGVKL